jgi:DegV family protein with EDD domain
LPTTSQPSIGDFLEVYEPLLDEGREIVSIHLAGGMSGTVRSAEQARDQLGPRAEQVHVIDSATACGGQGLVLLAAAAAARSGATGAEVAQRARDARAQLKMWFAIETLEYLRRGGRIAGAQAWLGTALKIKPILTVESEITPIERVRTSRRAFERMVDLLRSRHEDGADGWMVQHIQAPNEAAELAARGREVFGCDPMVISEIGPVIGTHVGPGLLGAGAIPTSLL